MKLFSTSCESLFLGWDAPLLPRAATALRERFADRQRMDLSSLICVLPTTHGVRRLGALLAADARSHDLQYQAPEIVTVGQLAERLYRPEMPLALEFEQTLAWAQVLRGRGPDDLQPLIATVPAAEPIGPWLELAGALRRLHEELASSQLAFDDVIEASETDAEKRRWKLLATLYADYLDDLRDVGLADPHHARRQALVNDQCRTDRTVVLVGASDLSDSLIEMLRSLDSDLISLVAAPPTAAFQFDEFGCVDTEAWMDHDLPLRDNQLISAGDIADQAVAVAESLAEFGVDYSPDQVTVGVTDESHVGPVEVQLRGCGVSTHRHLGWTVAQTAIGRLFDLTATYLQRRTWQSLAALVRHADVAAYITNRLGAEQSAIWLTQLDQLLSEYFPVRTTSPLTAAAVEKCPLALAVSEWVDQWLRDFCDADRSISKWSVIIERWLTDLYGDGNDERPDAAPGLEEVGRTKLALRAALRVIRRFSGLNDDLDLAVSGGAAIETLAGRLADVRIIEAAKPEDIEILGWLDLALDDAPAVVVIGVNHPFVPATVTSDPFLPGSLRSRLRMADNERRFARDLYAMHVVLSSRECIRLIVGRTAADGSPTPPSRLLAATPASDSARRIRQLLGGRRERVSVHHGWDQGPQRGLLPIPDLQRSQPSSLSTVTSLSTMSVTAFRDYLACPYRFYLRHVLKLKPLDDSASELAANQFGDLVHGAVERFGLSSDRNEADPAKIEAMMIAHLHDLAAEQYGDSVSTAVTLQVAQAARRLRCVARVQAARIADGWMIHATEASVDEKNGAGVDVDGRRMGLRGRFDRIDYHADSDRWAILDYKTHGHRPEKKHLLKTDDGYQWIDLQLPLYRMMVPFLGIDAEPSQVALGYFNVAEKDEETRINIAEFSEPQMQAAEDLIHDCIRRIWAGDFQPTSERVPFDDYGMILQTGVASRLLDQAETFVAEGADR